MRPCRRTVGADWPPAIYLDLSILAVALERGWAGHPLFPGVGKPPDPQGRRVQMTEVPALPSHHLLSPGGGLHSHQLLHGEEVGLKLQPPTFPEALEPSAAGGPHLLGIPRPSDCGEGC